ncbi:MAG: ornithine carbamoyltransferase [Jatrophihabitantaceae bacterium]
MTIAAPHTAPHQRIHPGSCLSLGDLTYEEQAALVTRARALADGAAVEKLLKAKTVGILFTATSTRTRTAFTAASIRLGSFPITYGPADLQTCTGESMADTGRVFGSMLDMLVARTAGSHTDLVTIAESSGIPVINAMTAEEHPTQAIGDLAIIEQHVGLAGVRLLYVGEGNNTAVALAYALAVVADAQVTFATPSGFGLPLGCLDLADGRAAASGSRARLHEVHTLTDLPEAVDIVYTTRWQTTGTSKPDPDWRQSFLPFRVDHALLDRWPAARFMHDLPAHRGEEVTGGVLDGPRSLAWEQARMKLYGAMAVLERAGTMHRL